MGNKLCHEARGKIEDALLGLRHSIYEDSGAMAASIKIMTNGDVSGIFLFDGDGSAMHIAITEDGNHVSTRHFFPPNSPFDSMLDMEME